MYGVASPPANPLAEPRSSPAPKSPATAAKTTQPQMAARLESCNRASRTRVRASVKNMPAHASTSEQSANASHEAIKLTGNCSHREEMPNVSAATMSATPTR